MMSLVQRGIATYQEITSYWDIDELHAMHEILDIRDDLEAAHIERMKAGAPQPRSAPRRRRRSA